MQCPYYVHRALKVVLDLPDKKVRVVRRKPAAVSAARKMPVDHRLSRGSAGAQVGASGQAGLRPRRGHAGDHEAPSSVIRHRTGVTRDGRLTAIDIDAVFDGGAYATLSAVVLSRGMFTRAARTGAITFAFAGARR
jgi:CO/xanthine dehydrogenase Mo-binding subunit